VRILITGGAGFLGSHLCERLLGMGHEVTCVDNLITGSMDNLAHLAGHERFRFVQHNVCDYLFVEGPLDAVMHFASPASPQDYLEYPIATLKVGALGTHKALGLAKAKNARFLLASTSEVYGDPLIHPQTESYNGNVNPIGRRACYDEGKRVAEALFFEYYRNHAVDIRVARIFNTFGPRMAQHDGRVVSNFILQALRGEDITVYGDGKQTRSFCYISDMVDGLYRLMNEDFAGPANVGNPEELTILEIAERIIRLTGSSSAVVLKDRPEDDPHRRKPDITLAKEKLRWQPVVSLDEGLRETIDYFRTVL